MAGFLTMLDTTIEIVFNSHKKKLTWKWAEKQQVEFEIFAPSYSLAAGVFIPVIDRQRRPLWSRQQKLQHTWQLTGIAFQNLPQNKRRVLVLLELTLA